MYLINPVKLAHRRADQSKLMALSAVLVMESLLRNKVMSYTDLLADTKIQTNEACYLLRKMLNQELLIRARNNDITSDLRRTEYSLSPKGLALIASVVEEVKP